MPKLLAVAFEREQAMILWAHELLRLGNWLRSRRRRRRFCHYRRLSGYSRAHIRGSVLQTM